MKDRTVVKLVGMIILGAMASTYFVFVEKDGAIFGTVAAAIGTIVGTELGKKE